MEQKAAREATPLNPRSHTSNFPSHSSQMGSPHLNSNNIDTVTHIRDPLNFLYPRQDQGQPLSGSGHHQMHELHQGDQRPRNTATVPAQVQDLLKAHFDRHNAVITNLQTLRSNATVSDAVNNLLASYEGRIHADIQQGKQQLTKRSGRYNTHDTISGQAHLRWPNEGFHASNGKKRLSYDELSLSQWVAGQLTNIHVMSDYILVKQAIFQMTLAMCGAESLPWAAVKSASAYSMCEVEEGLLTWVDSTQWVINRLSTSPVALVQPQLPAASSST